MALLERSLINSSHEIHDIGEFFINPEYLTDEELQYELRIRSELIQGNRRELSARLREIIKQERSKEREVPLTCYSVPSQELNLCAGQLNILEDLLNSVDADAASHNRYMTKHLHLEGRVNRIPKANTKHDITNGVFGLNERMSDMYNEFIAKIVNLKKTKTHQAPVGVNNLFSIAQGGGDGMSIADELPEDNNENRNENKNNANNVLENGKENAKDSEQPVVVLDDEIQRVQQIPKQSDRYVNTGARNKDRRIVTKQPTGHQKDVPARNSSYRKDIVAPKSNGNDYLMSQLPKAYIDFQGNQINDNFVPRAFDQFDEMYRLPTSNGHKRGGKTQNRDRFSDQFR